MNSGIRCLRKKCAPFLVSGSDAFVSATASRISCRRESLRTFVTTCGVMLPCAVRRAPTPIPPPPRPPPMLMLLIPDESKLRTDTVSGLSTAEEKRDVKFARPTRFANSCVRY